MDPDLHPGSAGFRLLASLCKTRLGAVLDELIGHGELRREGSATPGAPA